MQPTLSMTGALADFAAGTQAATIADSARAAIRRSLLDWAACAIAGMQEPVSIAVRSLVSDEAGKPEASGLGCAVRLPARAAALLNGATSHALDYDDTHFDYVGHPSVAIVPAALAMAERTGAGGGALIDAVAIGFEIACRVGGWLGAAHYNHGFHQTSTAGCFGATAAAGRLLCLDSVRMRHALGIAATRASGLKSQFGTFGKPYHAGMAAANGIEAALLAQQGFVSRPDGIECEQGFAATHAGAGGDPVAALAGLGAEWRLERVQYKVHACCHGTHAALEALKEMRERSNLLPERIEHVEIAVNPRWLRVCDIAAPVTGLEAKFSYRLTAAMALSRLDTGALATFSDAACHDRALTVLRDKVRAIGEAGLSDTAARVTLRRSDGPPLTNTHDLDAPIETQVLTAKLLGKASALVGAGRAQALWACLEQLDGQPATRIAALLR